MFSLILKVIGGVVGIIAAWYISKKLASWFTAINKIYEQWKEDKLREQLRDERKRFEENQAKVRKKIDDFLGGDGAH